MPKILTFLFLSFSVLACVHTKNSTLPVEADFSIEKMKPLISELGATWGEAIKKKDIDLIKNLYDVDAHYLPNDHVAIHGRDAIAQYWEESFPFLSDLSLTMESLAGSEELLYETGNGFVMIMNAQGNYDKFPFKYVNVWKQQRDGSYKVAIDIFNNIQAPN